MPNNTPATSPDAARSTPSTIAIALSVTATLIATLAIAIAIFSLVVGGNQNAAVPNAPIVIRDANGGPVIEITRHPLNGTSVNIAASDGSPHIDATISEHGWTAIELWSRSGAGRILLRADDSSQFGTGLFIYSQSSRDPIIALGADTAGSPFFTIRDKAGRTLYRLDLPADSD